MTFFDENPSFINWSSEEISVPYFNPLKNKMSNYYPDFMLKVKTKTGEIETWMVEIKPWSMTAPPKGKSKMMLVEWAINNSKWNSAIEYCSKKNIKFTILTEKNLK